MFVQAQEQQDAWERKRNHELQQNFPCVSDFEKGTTGYAFDGYCWPIAEINHDEECKLYEKVEECAQLCKARDAKGFSTMEGVM